LSRNVGKELPPLDILEQSRSHLLRGDLLRGGSLKSGPLTSWMDPKHALDPGM